MDDGGGVGTIIWESKNTKNWSIMDGVEAKASLDFAKEFVEKIGIIIYIDKK